MSENPIRISVVVAVYNAEKYLSQMMDSLLSQTLQEIEVICVDDGSTDTSLEILKRYAERDKRIEIRNQTEASDGAALARNMGIQIAKGKYIAVLDADDFFELDMLEKAYQKAEESNADVTLFDGYVFDDSAGTDRETGMILRPEYLPAGKTVFEPKENAENLFFMTIGSAWNALFSTDFVRREQLEFQSFHHADDLGFVYLAYASANRIAVLSERLIHYRINNPNSQAGTLDRWPEAAGGALKAFKKKLEEKGLFAAYRVSFVQLALKYFDTYVNAIKDAGSFEEFYTEWKNRYMEVLGLDALNDEQFSQRRLLQLRNAIRDLSPAAFLFRKMKHQKPFDRYESVFRKMKPDSRIIIYGAGQLGHMLFLDVLQQHNYCITAWVDQAYDSIGYPVMSPDEISRNRYDYILVAVESEAVYDRVCEWLRSKSVPDAKIVWAGSGI